jgi:glycosyltransferase involved in cell wall biosynthesis
MRLYVVKAKPCLKICFVLTDPINLHSLYRDQFSYLKSNSVLVTAIASPGREHEWVEAQGAKSIPISIARNPDILRDIISLLRIWFFFLFNRFDVVVVSTPKASLIGALAARLSFQKRLIFMVRGRAYENMFGVKRWLFRMIDVFVCRLSNRVQSISKELAQKYVDEGICRREKIVVLGLGSSNGVDLSKFDPSLYLHKRSSIRRGLAIDDKSFVFMFCGRVRRDKGINELVGAFKRFLSDQSGANNTILLVVGRYEEFDPLYPETRSFLEENPQVRFVQWARFVEQYFSIADAFVFPSYREGFGNVALEASAMELPVIAFDVVGCRESVDANKSGVLVEAFSEDALFEAMIRIYQNPELRQRLGRYGRERIESYFDSDIVWARLLDFYKEVAS